MPANYTKDHKQEITSEHKADVEDWFSKNLPGASVKSAAAYSDARDLYAAMSGSYKINGETYDYLYDYYNGKMYLGQEYKNAIAELERLSADYFGASASEVSVTMESGFGTGVLTMTENDSFQQVLPGEEAKNGFSKISIKNVIPYGLSGEEYADKLFAGEELEYGFTLNILAESIPEYDNRIFSDITNLAYVSYSRPIDWEYKGVYHAVYYDTFVISHYISITQVDNNLYAGFYTDEKLEYDKDTGTLAPATVYDKNIVYEKTGDKSFTVEIPDNSILFLFSKKADYYTLSTNLMSGQEDEYKFEKMNKSDSGKYYKGYNTFEAFINLPDSNYYGYTLKYVKTNPDGKYNVIIK